MKNIFCIDRSVTTFLKGIAILLVVFGHMGYIYKGGSWGVNLFLLLSGYGVFKSYVKNGTNEYFKKKLLKVFLPYFLVTLFMIIYYYLKHKIGLKMVIFSLLGIDFGYICDKTMWFISFIFVQYIIFYISIKLFDKIKNEDVRYLLIICYNFIFNCVIYGLDVTYMLWGRGAGIHLYIFSFSLGLVISKLSFMKINGKLRMIIFSTFSFCLMILILLLYNNVFSKFSYFIYAISFPLLLIMLIELNIIKSKNSLINYIGKISFDIYLWEGFFWILRDQILKDFGNYVLIDICIIILCIFVSQIYRCFFIKPVLNYISNINKTNYLKVK